MKKTSFKINTNWIAFVILFGAFVVSAVRYCVVAERLDESDDAADGEKIIRVTHWQLEPGYRESLEWAIEQYNALPHVQEAKITVQQEPIPERVYTQFMNVHLISGTAPDIAVKGHSELTRGNALAKFFVPLGDYVESPNRYNELVYQIPDLPESLSDYLAEAPWRDTFFDGMQGGYDTMLSDFYAVTASTYGSPRAFYNLDLLRKVKAFALEATLAEEAPAWLETIWRSSENPKGFLSEESGVEWLRTEALPETLGQFMLYCYAVQAYAKAEGLDYLVPISGSSYSSNNLAPRYEAEFLADFWEEISFQAGEPLHAMESLSGYSRDVWGFNSPAIEAYFEFVDLTKDFYPTGFMGLDREQAHRRFVLGQTAIILTGGWDASSLFDGVASRDNPEDRFDIEIAPTPLPAPGERWYEFAPMRRSEADIRGAVPFAINKQTPHLEWSLDFLRFITSHRINEGMNKISGWLPVISGAEPPEKMVPFLPIVEGFPIELVLSMGGDTMPASIRNEWSSTTKLFLTDDISYPELQAHLDDFLQNPQRGIRDAWVDSLQNEKDKARANDRAVSVERLSALFGSEEAAERERSLIFLSLTNDEGVHIRKWWRQTNPGDPFPKFGDY